MARKCLFFMAMVGTVLFSGFCAYGQTEHKIVFQNVWSPGHRNCENATRFINAVMAETKGRIKFESHYGEPIPAAMLLDACGVGTIDAFNSGTPYYAGKVGIGDFMMMPNNFATWVDFYDAFIETDIWKIMDSVYRKASNTTIIFPFVINADERFQFKKGLPPITRLGQLKGMKIRATGGALHEVVKLLGAVPVNTITGEYYTAMQRGTIDGGLMPDYTFKQYKTAEVCDQVLLPPVFQTGGTPIWMNVDKWNGLPKDLQDAINRVARSRELYMQNLNHILKEDEEVEKWVKEKYNIKYRTMPDEDINKMRELVEPTWDWFVDNCAKQGFGEEAKKIRNILKERFAQKNK